LRQSAHTEQLLYKPEETLTELSQIMDLSQGDLILTGTPGGVALKLTSEVSDQLLNPFLSGDKKLELLLESQIENSQYLKRGDIVKCQVKSVDGHIDLGIMENRVVTVDEF
jgi:2-keto-4-pentenoate hydratase/2-oxohepta-3-ene-1,7-dioic acid hydratase in catechol pathway